MSRTFTHTVVASIVTILVLAAAGSTAGVSGAQRVEGPPVTFADVRSILATCETCHGELQVSGLDLRTRDGALKGGDQGPALVPGSADRSRLYRRIAGLDQPAMPLNGSLSADQIATVKAWIDQGAHWET